MTDHFDVFLANTLAPQAGEADRVFVQKVQALIALDEQVRAKRRAVFVALALEVVALAAFAAALLWVAQSPAVVALALQSPAIVLTVVVVGFIFFAVTLSSRPRGTIDLRQPASALSFPHRAAR